ncbi:MAG: hypothetical protein ACRC6U_00575 [Fusobacteriaceae bacterium]
MSEIKNKKNDITLFDKKILSGNEMNYSLNVDGNSILSADSQNKIDKNFKDNIILTGDGKVNIASKALPLLMKTNEKTVKIKIMTEVQDEDKREIEGKLYISQSSVSSMVINARDNADTKEKEEVCQRTLNNLNIVENLPVVQNQRTKTRELINKEDKINKKEALKMGEVDALTGEKLTKSVVHHDKSKAVFPPREFLHKDNYKVINQKNHIEGHRNGILDDPSTDWEEKQERFKVIEKK